MQLIGYLESPFVRRVAISARFMDLPLDVRQVSIVRDYAEFRQINPLVKAPTLVCDDGRLLVDSILILDYLARKAGDDSLMPRDDDDYVDALSIIGTAMVANEKTVQLIYELQQRPDSARHAPWSSRVREQLAEATAMLESAYAGRDGWRFGDRIGQADITAAVAWRFTQLHYADVAPALRHPALAALSARAEALPEFLACPIT